MELVVLLDEDGQPIGQMAKDAVHHTDTPFHLAFSCYVLAADGRLLVTRRALQKQAWPGVWSNSFCGHPRPGESLEDAVRRRAEYELGIELTDLRVELPDFRYRAVDANGIVENEYCPVYIARSVGRPDPRDDEVVEFAWADPERLTAAVLAAPFAFSPWLRLQLPLLDDALRGEAAPVPTQPRP